MKHHDCTTDHQGRAPCTCNTLNDLSSEPHKEPNKFAEFSLDFIQALLILGFLTFTIFGLIGYWSAL